jgi:hypothetical protein
VPGLPEEVLHAQQAQGARQGAHVSQHFYFDVAIVVVNDILVKYV